jgi:hypothetical protein
VYVRDKEQLKEAHCLWHVLLARQEKKLLSR